MCRHQNSMKSYENKRIQNSQRISMYPENENKSLCDILILMAAETLTNCIHVNCINDDIIIAQW